MSTGPGGSAGRSQWFGVGCAVAAVLLWSTAEVVTRTVLDSVGPIELAFIRFTSGGLFLLLFLPGYLRARGVGITPRFLAMAFGFGVIGVTLSNLCFNFALLHIGAGPAATIYATMPMMVFVMAVLFLKEEFSGAKLIGVLLGLAGVAVLGATKVSANFSALGFALSLGATLAFSVFTVLMKRFGGAYTGLPLIAVATIFGGLSLGPMALVFEDVGGWDPISWDGLAVAYLALGPAGMSYLLFGTAIQYADATLVSSTLFLKPPVAAALAALALGEAVTWNLGASMVFILAGLVFIFWVRRGALDRLRPVSPAAE